MRLTLPLVALGVIQISYIYCSAAQGSGQDRHMERMQALHRRTKWNEDKHGNIRSHSSSKDLVFKSQGSRKPS
ncbi:hypothetical protein CHS0354_042331 [Potamilus streckersoni]|uniref:Secreted protein n=1 Tax=Potamilus streckersoni TaxID=2493646 RepID=A0AAE0SUF3_9BIVA|nr:hypothetical protein CHS0354_042331 [Potamilus streckersoni]